MKNQDIYQKMKYVRSFIKTPTIPAVDDEVWELFGVCLGDGCLSRYLDKYNSEIRNYLIITGNSIEDYEYYYNHLLPILRAKFGIEARPRIRSNSNTIDICIGSKTIFDFFRRLGMPVGKKKDKIRITARVLKSPKSAKAAVLRGLLDTDGHIFARKDECYKYPYLEILSASQKFLNQLKDLIRQFGLPAYIHDTNVLVRGGKNLISWMNFIGTSHPVHRRRYIEWLQSGKLLPKSHLANVDASIGKYQNGDK